MKMAFQMLRVVLKVTYYFFGGPVIISFFRELVLQAKIAVAVLRDKKILNIVLIKPSKYEDKKDEDEIEFVLQDWKGVLPSNTLATLYSLIKDIQDNLRLSANVWIVARVFDEAVQKVRPNRIARLCSLFGTKSIVMLAGVQTNQFARATDLAIAFQKKGIQTIIGGFHVSGVLARFPQDGKEVNERAFEKLGLLRLVESGVSLFAGEAEGRMLDLLQDFMSGKLKSVYNFLDNLPDLIGEPVPLPIPGMENRFVMPHMGTIDSCRGCPYNCSFCSIGAVQGKKIRARDVQGFRDAIRRNWKNGTTSYFFTSDNLSRDPLWKERFEALIAMREEEGIKVDFLMQVDARCYLIPGFIEKAAKAGCSHAFIGIESVSPENLEAVQKKQNKVDDYNELNKAFSFWGIVVDYGYILGFPKDTRESIARDIQTLIEFGPDLVFFFMMVPVPGSTDHYRMFCNNEWMDPDFNAYDGFTRPVFKHPNMTDEEWISAYQDAWKTFYSVENMVRILKRTERRHYWKFFWNLIFCKHAIDVAQRHPMISGFVRVYDRKSRRKSFPRMGWLKFRFYKFKETMKTWKRTVKLVLELKEVWLQTRERSVYEKKVATLAANLYPGEWFSVKVKDLKEIHQSLGEKVPSRFRLIGQQITLRSTRADVQAHWNSVRSQLSRGRFWVLLRWRSIRAFVTDTALVSKFLSALQSSWEKRER